MMTLVTAKYVQDWKIKREQEGAQQKVAEPRSRRNGLQSRGGLQVSERRTHPHMVLPFLVRPPNYLVRWGSPFRHALLFSSEAGG